MREALGAVALLAPGDEAGVAFLEAPRAEPCGTVAVFRDPFGNRRDPIEPRG